MYLEDGAGLEDVVGLAKDIKGLARILGKIWIQAADCWPPVHGTLVLTKFRRGPIS